MGEVVHSKIVYDRETGQSRGFGFVDFRRQEYSDRALRMMNGVRIDGRNVRVENAIPH